MTGKKSIKDLVKNKEWQSIRQSLVGQWNLKPDWCCKQLKTYLGPINKTSNDKIRITINYLTGTGFRMGKIKNPCIGNIRTQLSSEIKKRKAKGKW